MRSLLDEKMATYRYIRIGLACIFIIYISLAIWIRSVVQDVQKSKQEAIARELQTDSLKRAVIREMAEKYNSTVDEWRNLDNGKDNGEARSHSAHK